MVQYGHDPVPPTLPAPTCPKCGSHRTQVIGRLEDGKTFIIRCNGCGAHSTLVADELTREFVERLPFDDAPSPVYGNDQNRVTRDGSHR